MSTYNKLATELADDPLERGYSGMTDVQAAGSLNTVNRDRVVAITSAELLAWSGGGANDGAVTPSRYERIETAAKEHTSLAVRGASKAAIQLIGRDGTTLNLALTDRMGMVDALVVGGVLTTDEKTALVALGTETITRAAELGIRRVLPGHVMKAR